ncbi:MAG: toxin HigB, partial [Acidobacteriota bacterium]|nr:toxin HigB [Acidobacteriota bacterium]
ILALLDTTSTIEDMDLPGLKLHELKGNRKETWSVTVSGNWRVTFQIDKGDVYNVDYEDYH